MKALLLVDLQNDFYTLGASAIPGVDEIIPIANQLMQSGYFDCIVATQDWHPATHQSFAANHYFRYPKQRVDINGSSQLLWGMHGIQDSYGADLIDDLKLDKIDKIVQKGQNEAIESYSPFFDNAQNIASDLADYLHDKAVEQVFILGVPLEYSVKYTALDSVKLGFQTFLLEDACRPIHYEEGAFEEALKEMQAQDVSFLDSDQLIL